MAKSRISAYQKELGLFLRRFPVEDSNLIGMCLEIIEKKTPVEIFCSTCEYPGGKWVVSTARDFWLDIFRTEKRAKQFVKNLKLPLIK
jgi:hypothetical protein